MAFTPQEKQLISWGKANGKSKEEVQQALVNLRSGIKPAPAPSPEPSEPGYLERLGTAYKTAAENIITEVKRPAEEVEKGAGPLETVKNLAETGLRTVGEVAGVAFAPVTEAVSPALKPVAEKFASLPVVRTILQYFSDWANKNPNAAKDLESAVNIATLGFGKAVEVPVKEATTQFLKESGEAVAKGSVKAGQAIQPAVDMAKAAGEAVSRVPKRIAINMAEKEAATAAVNALPSKIAQTAVREGIDIQDVKTLLSIPVEQKPHIKKLADSVKAFASGESKTNPIEVVGEPIVQRVSLLRSEQAKIGQQLGEASKNLGVVTEQELRPSILAQLQRVPGLERLTEKDGILNFKFTVLTTGQTAADREAIQSIFNQAITWGNGEAKHRLRQELFEILGGKKKAGIQLTDTQEKAYQAIRTGLMDVLESKNPEYRTLSQQYRKITQPLEEINRRMKGLVGADEDIANMSAGLLARRITSAATSNPEIRQLLKSLDEATPELGDTLMSTETAQDVYNILNRYYDIAPKTGYQGLTQTAVEKGTVKNAITEAVTSVIGKTDATRQKALEDLIAEILAY